MKVDALYGRPAPEGLELADLLGHNAKFTPRAEFGAWSLDGRTFDELFELGWTPGDVQAEFERAHAEDLVRGREHLEELYR